MSELDHNHSLNHSLNTLSEALQSGRFVRMRRLLASLHPAETAHLLESLPPAERKVCWPICLALPKILIPMMWSTCCKIYRIM